MSTNAYTTDLLLESMRRRGLLPRDGRIDDEDALQFMTDELISYIAPLAMSTRDQYYKYSEDVALVAGTTNYALPTRAISDALQLVQVVDSGGNVTNLNYLEPERESEFHMSAALGFRIEDAQIVLVPDELPSRFTTLRMTYFRIPNRLTLLEDEDGNPLVGKVTAKTSTTVTIDAAPSTFSTSEPVDFISGSPGFRWKGVDVTPTVVAGTILTFSSADIPSNLAVGDFVCHAGESPVPQCPSSLLPLLKQAATVTILEALKDAGAKAAAEKRTDMERRILPTLSPRVQNARRVIFNRFSPGGRASLRWWR